MVSMTVRQLAIDNRPQLGSFLTKFPLIRKTPLISKTLHNPTVPSMEGA